MSIKWGKVGDYTRKASEGQVRSYNVRNQLPIKMPLKKYVIPVDNVNTETQQEFSAISHLQD